MIFSFSVPRIYTSSNNHFINGILWSSHFLHRPFYLLKKVALPTTSRRCVWWNSHHIILCSHLLVLVILTVMSSPILCICWYRSILFIIIIYNNLCLICVCYCYRCMALLRCYISSVLF